MTEISVAELQARRAAAADFVLLDVREPDEVETASVAGATTIPMGEVPQRLAELPQDRPIVVMCHHGRRSANVTSFLNANGYPNAINLEGGIDAWSVQIDPSVPRY